MHVDVIINTKEQMNSQVTTSLFPDGALNLLYRLFIRADSLISLNKYWTEIQGFMIKLASCISIFGEIFEQCFSDAESNARWELNCVGK